MRIFPRPPAIPLLLVLTFACGEAPEAVPPALEVIEPWAQVLPNGTGTVYFSVENSGGSADRLVAVEIAAAKAAETHESIDDNGVMRMVARPEGFEIPAGDTLVLEPGGKHVMLMEPSVDDAAQTLALTLRFERTGAVEAEAEIRRVGSGTDHGEMDHGEMDHGEMDHKN